MERVYLDYHSTSPLDPRVLEAMLPYFHERFGNPSSRTHPFGWQALEAVEAARKEVAELVGASPREIIFTAGATESNNIAILGTAASARSGRKHIVTQAIEHQAVLKPVEELGKRGFDVTVLRPDSRGRIRGEQVREALTDRTILVSIMAAQNEVGTIEPTEDIGKVCRDAGVLFHSDAAQAVGKTNVDVDRAEIDLLSLSAHKFCGPKGIGALYVRRRGKRVRLRPVTFGGGQENGLRPGTLNVPAIVGFGEASRIARSEREEEGLRVAALRDRLFSLVERGVPDVQLNGPPFGPERLPGNLSLSFRAVDGAALLVALKDIAASAGSACTAGSVEPSYVLSALGVRGDLATATLRLGLGRFTTEGEVESAAGRIVETVHQLRRASHGRRPHDGRRGGPS